MNKETDEQKAGRITEEIAKIFDDNDASLAIILTALSINLAGAFMNGLKDGDLEKPHIKPMLAEFTNSTLRIIRTTKPI